MIEVSLKTLSGTSEHPQIRVARFFCGCAHMSSAVVMAAASPSPLSRRLEGKVAVITGGSSGIGESIARLFRQHGAKLCIIDLKEELGQQLCETLGGEDHAIFVRGDVTVEDDVLRAVDTAVEKFGALDVLVNNAGIIDKPSGEISSIDAAEFKRVFDVNVNGALYGMKYAARAMIPRGRGAIVSIASVSSVIGGAGPHGYTASKHALLGLTRSVAAELGKHGIRVNCVSPYAIPTGLALPHLPDHSEDVLKSFLEFTSSKGNLSGVRLTAEDVADAVLYLACDEAKYVSGLNLVLDGGFTCVNHDLRVFR